MTHSQKKSENFQDVEPENGKDIIRKGSATGNLGKQDEEKGELSAVLQLI